MYRLTKAHAYGLGDPSSTLPSASSLAFLQPLLSRLWAEQSCQVQSLSQWSCYTLHTKIKYLLVLMVLCVPAPTWVPQLLHCNAPSGAINVQCNAQSETTPRGEAAKTFQCCVTVCKGETGSWEGKQLWISLYRGKHGRTGFSFTLNMCQARGSVEIPFGCGNFSSLSCAKDHEKYVSLQGTF